MEIFCDESLYLFINFFDDVLSAETSNIMLLVGVFVAGSDLEFKKFGRVSA